MRKFKLNCNTDLCSAPIADSKEKMVMTRPSKGYYAFKRISVSEKTGEATEMEWEAFTPQELKTIYMLITEGE